MRMIALVTAFLVGLIAPGLAQQAEIEAVNAKWIDFFNKGDFAGIALLYTEDATALPRAPPQQRAELRLRSCGKAWRSKWAIPKLTTLDVKSLGPSAAREIGTFSLKAKGSTPREVVGKYVVVWDTIGSDRKLATDIWNEGK